MCGKDAVVDIKLDCQWKLIKEHRVSRTVIISLLRIKGGLGFIQRVWELQVFEGILQFFFFAFVNFHPKLYCTGVLETRLDIDGLKFSAQLETVLRVLLGRGKKKRCMVCAFRLFVKSSLFLALACLWSLLKSYLCNKPGQWQRVVRECCILSFLCFLTSDWLLFSF